ncbi:MAG TPA: histone deacetylase, partial [Bryobacterales bacterium]|nr:histone deacetylase [Bryobacterales bacterium]
MASAAKSTALLADPVYREHETGAGHPERPERYDAVAGMLRSAGVMESLLRVPSRPATDDELALCHGRAYIQIVKRDVASGARELSTGDTAICERSLDGALYAVGGVLNAVDAVMAGQARNAFCVVRPPGHHARPDQGMG